MMLKRSLLIVFTALISQQTCAMEGSKILGPSYEERRATYEKIAPRFEKLIKDYTNASWDEKKNTKLWKKMAKASVVHDGIGDRIFCFNVLGVPVVAKKLRVTQQEVDDFGKNNKGNNTLEAILLSTKNHDDISPEASLLKMRGINTFREVAADSVSGHDALDGNRNSLFFYGAAVGPASFSDPRAQENNKGLIDAWKAYPETQEKVAKRLTEINPSEPKENDMEVISFREFFPGRTFYYQLLDLYEKHKETPEEMARILHKMISSFLEIGQFNAEKGFVHGALQGRNFHLSGDEQGKIDVITFDHGTAISKEFILNETEMKFLQKFKHFDGAFLIAELMEELALLYHNLYKKTATGQIEREGGRIGRSDFCHPEKDAATVALLTAYANGTEENCTLIQESNVPEPMKELFRKYAQFPLGVFGDYYYNRYHKVLYPYPHEKIEGIWKEATKQ